MEPTQPDPIETDTPDPPSEAKVPIAEVCSFISLGAYFSAKKQLPPGAHTDHLRKYFRKDSHRTLRQDGSHIPVPPGEGWNMLGASSRL